MFIIRIKYIFYNIVDNVETSYFIIGLIDILSSVK